MKIIGFLLLFALPLLCIGAGIYSYFQPRLYSATTSFQLKHAEADVLRIRPAFEKAREDLRSLADFRLASHSTLNLSQPPDHFAITAIDLDPLTTATTANTLSVFINNSLRDASGDQFSRMEISAQAEMPRKPSFPNVPRMIMTTAAIGAPLSLAGVILLVIGSKKLPNS